MDGYAVRWADVCDAAFESPVLLKLVGESRAGLPFTGIVGQGEAVAISTGAMLAAGCDTVIRVEDTKEQDSIVSIFSVRQQGQDVRHKGEEFQVGALLIHKRTKISAPQAALLTSVGITKIKTYKPCEVAILVTGSELVSAGDSIADHQIRDSNMIMLKAAIKEAEKSGLHVLWNLPSGGLVKNFDKETYFKYRNHPLVREDNMFWAGKNKCPAGRQKIYITAKKELMPCDRWHKSYNNLEEMRKDFEGKKVWCSRLGDVHKGELKKSCD